MSNGSAATVTVQFCPTSAGSFSSSATVSSSATFTGTNTVTLFGTGVQNPILSINTSSLGFGTINIGSSADQTFFVSNGGGGTLTGSVNSPNPPFSLVAGGGSFSFGAGQGQQVTVRFTPQSLGTVTGNVSVSSNGGSGNVSLIGTGQIPPEDTITITAGPTAIPNPVASGGQVQVSVSASDTWGHSLGYFWTGSGGSFSNASSATTTWTAPPNPTGTTQSYTVSVVVTDLQGSAAAQTRSRTVQVQPAADTVTITSGPSGNPNPVASGGTVSLSVTATDSIGHALSYTWSALCSGLPSNGGFNNANIQAPTWTAPTNTTGSATTCTLTVTASDGLGNTDTKNFPETVNSTSQHFTLTVTKTGTGSGTVTSNPAGINCGTDCTESYSSGTTVTLTATPSSGSTFAGWSGDADCSDGQVTMTTDKKSCTATFNGPIGSVPVVLVHGWGGNGQVGVGGTFGQMEPLLEQNGFKGRVYVYDYSDLTSCSSTGITIRHIAGKFWKWLGDNGFQGKQIDVVAHSMGGLVVRTYMAGMGIKEDGTAVPYGGEIRRLVMIGTPNYGVRAGVLPSLVYFVGCFFMGSPGSSLAIQAVEQQVGSGFLRSLDSEWQAKKPLELQNFLVIAGIKGNLVGSPVAGLFCPDSKSPEGNDDGVVNVNNTYLPGAHYREVPYKHNSFILCPHDGTRQAFIDSPSHFTFATLQQFLQVGTAPTYYNTRRLPGGIWASIMRRLFRATPSGLETQSTAEDLTWTEIPGGGLTPLSPAAAAAPNGEVYVVVQGIDNHIYLNIQRNGTWLGWTPHPSGRTGSSPAAVVDVNGNLQVFVHGVDNAIYQTTYSGGSWSEWIEVPGGGLTFSAPEAAVNRVTGELTLVVRGIDSKIYLNTYRGATWGGWSAVPAGGLTLSELGATYDASGTLWLFARGIDARVWVTSSSGGSWNGWTGLGGTTHSGLAAVASGDTVVVFAHGSDDRIYHNSYSNGQWSGWNEVPDRGLTKDAPAATVDSQGNVLLFVRGM